MAKKVIPNKLMSLSLQEDLRNRKMSILLGSTDTTTENTPETLNNVSNLGVAVQLTDGDIKIASLLPKGYKKYYELGKTNLNGYYNTTGSGEIQSGSQFYYLYNGFLFYITGFPGLNYREDRTGELIARSSLTDTTGKIARTSDGKVDYCAVAKIDNDFQLGNRYIGPLPTVKDSLKEFDRFSTKTIQANNICGPGREQHMGNCCLYYKENSYDSVAGTTHEAGEFFKCLCTRCYKCIDYAKKLNVDYIFKSYGGGDTGDSCLHCENETYPTDCGPCDCNKSQRSDYEAILSKPNLSKSLSSYANASIDKIGQEEIGGSIASVTLNMAGISDRSLIVTDAYSKKSVLSVPIDGDGENSDFRFVTVTEGGVRYVVGIDRVSGGQDYTHAAINSTTLSSMIQNINTNMFDINLVPLTGFIDTLLDTIPSSVVVSKTLTSTEIRNITDQSGFNQVSLGNIFDEDGRDFFADSSENESGTAKLSTTLTLQRVGAITPSSSDFNQLKIVSLGAKGLGEKIVSSKASGSNAKVEVNTARPASYTVGGDIITDDRGKEWNIIAKTDPPSSNSGKSLDNTKTKIHSSKNTKIALPNTQNETQVYTFNIRFGGEPQDA